MKIPALLAAATLVFGGEALAAGDEDEAAPKPTETTTQCEEGLIWDEETKTCLAPTNESFNDTDRYNAARELAYAGKLDAATIVLAAADNPNDPRILNYKGFTQRKLGNTAAAMAYYTQALQIDPDYTLARSYMGQGLVEMGQTNAAKVQLIEIAARGGIGTWPYRALKDTISGARSGY